ncbi:MAG TPA: IS1182 family transposase [Caldisericia bacterium]|jgi:transposase|nr:IS1182 family transposase [Caldisericia bacterium]
MGYIEGQDRNQIIMFPESIDEYISDDNSVRVIDAYVEQLDMEKLGFQRTTAPVMGRPPYSPKDLLKLYLYGYLNRVRSSRRLEHEAIRNIEVIWLLKKLKPDFKTIADFRKDNKKALKAVFRDFTKLCDEWNLFGKELVAIDGSKFRASNSKRNNYSAKKLERHIKYIDEKIENYMRELDEGDTTETCDRKPDASEIKEKLQQLRERKNKYEKYKEHLDKTGENEISTTDPDARLMCNNNNNVDVSYNIQTTVDSKHKIIVDFKVSQKPNDLGELDNMALRAKKLFKGKEFEALADKGYYKAEDLKKCVENGITPYVTKQIYSNGTGDRDFYGDRFKYDKDKNVYICPAGKELYYARDRKQKGKGIIGHEYRNYEACKNCEFKDRCTKSEKGRVICRHVDQDFLDTIDLQTELNMEKYKLRQMIVEHPYGTIKRSWGAYYFLTRRKISVTAEISLSLLVYNLKRVMNILGNDELIRRLKERKRPVLI